MKRVLYKSGILNDEQSPSCHVCVLSFFTTFFILIAGSFVSIFTVSFLFMAKVIGNTTDTQCVVLGYQKWPTYYRDKAQYEALEGQSDVTDVSWYVGTII